MEPHNLTAASSYINNVLLARGLLKNGQPIDFAEPENAEGGSRGTMARVINLVNELVLRRDREAEHRENLATTIRSLRADESHKTVEIEKLKTKNSELKRSLALAEAQERSLKTNAASADATIRGFKEQVQRMKTTIQQVRGQCANDIRKRDLEMQKLKSHLAERQRGKRDGLGVTTININPKVDRTSKMRSLAGGGEGLNDPGYSLRQETNDFLTELCQNLSDENDTLIVLARNTIQTLKELQGLPEFDADIDSGMASVGARSSHGPVTSLPSSCAELTEHMDRVLDHLKLLLTNPSFVPLEEVEIRDEEIKRLREGWEKMETRWSQAMSMMDGWHRRIADGGGSVQAEELRMGLTLDLSVASTQDATMDSGEEANAQAPIFEDQEAEEEEEAAQEQATQQPARTESKPRPNRALKERSDNIRSARSPRKVSFTMENKDSPDGPGTGEDDTLPVKAHRSDTVTRRPSKKKSDAKPAKTSSHPIGTHKNGQYQHKRMLSDETGQNAKKPHSSPMSVPQKLAAAENEARAAEESRRQDESRKRARGSKSTSTKERRRSTLTSDELGELMGVRS